MIRTRAALARLQRRAAYSVRLLFLFWAGNYVVPTAEGAVAKRKNYRDRVARLRAVYGGLDDPLAAEIRAEINALEDAAEEQEFAGEKALLHHATRTIH